MAGRRSSDIPKRSTGARDIAHEIIGFLSVTDTYIHTYIQTISEMRRRISCLGLRRSAMISCIIAFYPHTCDSSSPHAVIL